MSDALKISDIVQLGTLLRKQGYLFTTVTPETHRRVLGRPLLPETVSADQVLRQFFGWNRWLDPDLVPSDILKILAHNALLETGPKGVCSRIRFATLEGDLYAHSSFPTDETSAVFFGPDSYRFVHFIRRQSPKIKAEKILDIGCGSGVGVISGLPKTRHKIFCDINPQALIFAEANAQLNGDPKVEFYHADILQGAPSGADLLIANPPFIMDEKNRKYRDGGESYGAEVALKIVEQSLEYIKPGGCLALYTGSCIVQGRDVFKDLLAARIPSTGFRLLYEEIDPDIFGEELALPPYHDVERIAAIGMVLKNTKS